MLVTVQYSYHWMYMQKYTAPSRGCKISHYGTRERQSRPNYWVPSHLEYMPKFSHSFITARKRSYGKLMFLHLSVNRFTGCGCVSQPPLCRHPPGRHTTLGRHPPGRHRQIPLARDGHWSGSRHPTGMHSCFDSVRKMKQWQSPTERSWI